MAPEAMEKDEFTAAADVYSFGEWEGEREAVGVGRGGERENSEEWYNKFIEKEEEKVEGVRG